MNSDTWYAHVKRVKQREEKTEARLREKRISSLFSIPRFIFPLFFFRVFIHRSQISRMTSIPLHFFFLFLSFPPTCSFLQPIPNYPEITGSISSFLSSFPFSRAISHFPLPPSVYPSILNYRIIDATSLRLSLSLFRIPSSVLQIVEEQNRETCLGLNLSACT